MPVGWGDRGEARGTPPAEFRTGLPWAQAGPEDSVDQRTFLMLLTLFKVTSVLATTTR